MRYSTQHSTSCTCSLDEYVEFAEFYDLQQELDDVEQLYDGPPHRSNLKRCYDSVTRWPRWLSKDDLEDGAKSVRDAEAMTKQMADDNILAKRLHYGIGPPR